jgi:hypothetical protein
VLSDVSALFRLHIQLRDLRFFTYCLKPFMPRLNASRRECSMCRTRSLSSAFSSGVQPSSRSPCGRTAYRDSLSVEEIVLVWVSCGRDSSNSFPSSVCSATGVCSIALGTLWPITLGDLWSIALAGLELAVGRRVRLYVGRRLSREPRFGIKREFCTFVRVERVETSGSIKFNQPMCRVVRE